MLKLGGDVEKSTQMSQVARHTQGVLLFRVLPAFSHSDVEITQRRRRNDLNLCKQGLPVLSRGFDTDLERAERSLCVHG